MATELVRKRMIDMFRESRDPDEFLSGMFTVRPRNISSAEKIVIDIKRFEENISPVVGLLQGPTLNATKRFTTKEFTPPTISEAMLIEAGELTNRLPGMTEYDATDIGYLAALVRMITDNNLVLEEKIRRNRELQGGQILTTGIVTLPDEAGSTAYQVDYKPKATHFPTAGVAWDAGGDPYADIDALANVIRTNGKVDSDLLIMGDASWDAFLNNAKIQALLDNRRIVLGGIEPRQPQGPGGKFVGTIHIGNYKFDMWTYSGQGVLPGASTPIRYIPTDKCVVMSTRARRDTVFAGIPRVRPVDPAFAGILPPRVAVPGATDFATNIYSSLNGKSLYQELESRPLLIPTQIDGYGCIDTGV